MSTVIFRYEEDTGFGKFNLNDVDLILRGWLHDIGDFARDALVANAPFDTGRSHDTIEESRVNKMPDGFWHVEVGIGPVPPAKPGESPDYPKFTDEGTGMFREGGVFDGNVDTNMAFRPEHGNVMAFEKSTGETVFTRWVSGQPPQNYMATVEALTDEYIEMSKEEIAIKIGALLG